MRADMNGRAIIREGLLNRWQKAGAESILVICALFICAPVLFGQETYREFEEGLNLSDSQRAQVEEIKRKYMDEWMALRNQSLRTRLEMRELIRTRPDQHERLQKLQRELDQVDESKRQLFRRYIGDVSGVFNEEQRIRFNRFMNRENRRPMMPRYRFHE